LFDEATSVLDVSTERAVLASVASFHSHQTTMVNSLRIKSIVWVGSFVLLDQGRIVATGTSDLPFEEWTEVFGSERLAGCGGPGCSNSFRRFISGSSVSRFRLPVVLAGG
jgi:energy-coupling factor transporter ATP-binding protein EcfA2